MKRLHFGEANMGALAGAIVGAIGGLFGIGIAPAVVGKNPALLFQTPILALFCFLLCGAFGWLIGGQIGPRLAGKLGRPLVELIGGAFGGFVPVAPDCMVGMAYDKATLTVVATDESDPRFVHAMGAKR